MPATAFVQPSSAWRTDSAQTPNVDRGSQGFEEKRNAADKKIFIRDIGAFI
jgi:hypothetical protein